MNSYGYCILIILFLIEVFELILSVTNIRYSFGVKTSFLDNYIFLDKAKVEESLCYLKDGNRSSVLNSLWIMPFFYLLFVSGSLGNFILLINKHVESNIFQGIVFFTIYLLLLFLLSLPFDIYKTFVIEKKYGFNKTTWQLFLKDTLISTILGFFLLSLVIGGVLIFIEKTGQFWWLYASFLWYFYSLSLRMFSQH